MRQPPTKLWHFEIRGGFDIRKKFKPETDFMGNVVRFRMPDGRLARLFAGIEVEDKTGNKYQYVFDEGKLTALGFSCMDYEHLEFYEI